MTLRQQRGLARLREIQAGQEASLRRAKEYLLQRQASASATASASALLPALRSATPAPEEGQQQAALVAAKPETRSQGTQWEVSGGCVLN